MSLYYVIGTNKELDVKTDIFNYKKEDVSHLKKVNPEYLNEKFYYLIAVDNYIGYCITNYQEFYTDANKLHFDKFLKFIDTCLKDGYDISFYQFCDSNNKDIEENYIYEEKKISTNLYDYPDDVFNFEFNIKYVFTRELVLTKN